MVVVVAVVVVLSIREKQNQAAVPILEGEKRGLVGVKGGVSPWTLIQLLRGGSLENCA